MQSLSLTVLLLFFSCTFEMEMLKCSIILYMGITEVCLLLHMVSILNLALLHTKRFQCDIKKD